MEQLQSSIESAKQNAARRRVVAGASLGTILEYYDFSLYGSLAVIFSAQFFPAGSETAALLVSLLTYAVGYAIRPIGGLVFGRIGDKFGRKRSFLITIVIMGISTAGVGFLPTFETIGWAAPIILVLLRIMQGLAVGGEYSGAAVFVAEHSARTQRGSTTGWLQSTVTIGFAFTLVVIVGFRSAMSESDFVSWGWRLPFVASLALLALSVYIRLRLEESPFFLQMKKQQRSRPVAPIREALTNGRHLRLMIIACFGGVAAASTVWTMSQAYALIFILNTLKLEYKSAFLICAIAFSLGATLFVAFGALSDRVGRRPVMLAGCLLSLVLLFPGYRLLAVVINPDLAHIARDELVTVTGPAASCNVLLFAKPVTDCDRARDLLTRSGISFQYVVRNDVQETKTSIAGTVITGFDAKGLTTQLARIGYKKQVTLDMAQGVQVGVLLIMLMVCTAMVYAPLGAYMVELFPTEIRNTALSLPYNVGSTLFAGMVPVISLASATAAGDIFAALYYPSAVILMSLLVAWFFMPETAGKDLADVDSPPLLRPRLPRLDANELRAEAKTEET